MKNIIFSNNMLVAILDGKKTQTRRVIRIEPDIIDKYIPPDRLRFAINGQTLKIPKAYYADTELWVREAFCLRRAMKDGLPFIVVEYLSTDTTRWSGVIDYDNAMGNLKPFKNYPAMFMPKWASRLSIRLTAVRAERLKEISFDDINKEGITGGESVARQFIELWDSLHKKDEWTWEVNPWVQVLDFEVIKQKE